MGASVVGLLFTLEDWNGHIFILRTEGFCGCIIRIIRIRIVGLFFIRIGTRRRVVPHHHHQENVRRAVTMELCRHHCRWKIRQARDSGCVLVIVVIDVGWYAPLNEECQHPRHSTPWFANTNECDQGISRNGRSVFIQPLWWNPFSMAMEQECDWWEVAGRCYFLHRNYY